MKKLDYFISGMINGGLLGLLFPIITMNSNLMEKWWTSSLVIIFSIFCVSSIVHFGANKTCWYKANKKHTVMVAFMTLLIPVFGSTFGANGIYQIPVIFFIRFSWWYFLEPSFYYLDVT